MYSSIYSSTLVIGRGGEQITRLQRDSGAKIQMSQENNSRNERPCTISGTREAIGHAKELIFEIVNKGDRPDNRRGGFGGPPGMDGPPGGEECEPHQRDLYLFLNYYILFFSNYLTLIMNIN